MMTRSRSRANAAAAQRRALGALARAVALAQDLAEAASNQADTFAEEFEPANESGPNHSDDLATDRNRMSDIIEKVEHILPEQDYMDLYNALKTLCDNAANREATTDMTICLHCPWCRYPFSIQPFAAYSPLQT